MNINYKERYQLLLNQIKKRIKSNNLSDVIKEIYSKYIQIIEENIDESATENEYDNAINLLLITLDEIKELEAKTKESEEQSKILEEQINKLGYAQSLTQKRINTHKKNIVSYMLALAIFIGIPTGMYMKARNTPKEKLYRTSKEIHTTLDKEYEIMKPGYIYTNINDIATYTTTYEEKIPYDETIEIKEYSPWITEGTESKRKVVTIKKDAQSLGNRIYASDLPNLVLGYGSHQEYEYKYTVEIPYDDRQYTHKIYEITRIVQDTNDYIEKNHPISAYTDLIIILLIELLLILCEVEITENTILGHLIEEMRKLSQNKKINNNQRKELNELIYEYLKINKKNSKLKKRSI